MANSSKEYDSANRRVIVIKPNEFFSLKHLNLRQHREILNDLKTNLTGSNASFISKVCNQVDTSTSQGPIYAKEDGSCQHGLKLPKYKYVPPHSHKIAATPNKKYKRKISIVENGLEKTKLVDFADLSRATSITSTTNKTVADKNAENEIVDIDNDISEEKIIELIDKKYGAAIEAQLFQENSKIAQDPGAKLPSDIFEYRLREEEFINQNDKEHDVSEELKEAQRHLASILILDSPDDGYKLFTREELKRLPEKIFESPIKPTIKEEIAPNKETLDYVEEQGSIKEEIAPNKETLDYVEEQQPQNSDLKDVTQLQNLKIHFEDNPSIFDSTTIHCTGNLNNNANKCGNEAKVEAKNVKETENYTKDIYLTLKERTDSSNIPSTKNPKKCLTESEKQVKEIIFANEDAAIVKEIDEFIEEISIKNKVLRPQETSIVISESREKSDHNYCFEHIQTNQNCSEIEEENKTDKTNEEENNESVDEIIIDSSECSNICVDAARFEDVVKCIIKKNELFDQATIEENGNKYDENIINTEVQIKKSDILAKLILESEIHVDQTGDIDVTHCPVESHSSNVVVSETSLQECVSDSQIEFNKFSGAFKTSQLNADESAILIVKENGFLEPVNIDSNRLILESFSSYDQNQVTSSDLNETQSDSEENISEKSTSSEEKQKATEDKINREEILILMEKVRGFQYSGSDNFGNDVKTGNENMNLLGRSLIEHIGILKKLYDKLEIDTALAMEKLDQNITAEGLSDLHDNLNFIKSIVEQNFVKEEKKKLKYKVISVKRKSIDQAKFNSSTNKPVTKKVFSKTVPRSTNKISNKLLRKMLFRMNKLLRIVEKNEKMFLMNIRRKAFISKLKEITKEDIEGENAFERGLCSSTKKSNVSNSCNDEDFRTEKEQVQENLELQSSNSKGNSNKPHSKITKALTIALKRSDNGTVENDIRNVNEKEIEDIPSQKKSFIRLCFEKDNKKIENTSKINQLHKSPNAETIKFNTERKLQARVGKDLQAKENTLIKQEQPPRYPLRSRKTTNTKLPFNHTREYQKDKTENTLPFEVNFSNVITLNKSEDRKLDYILKNDNKPCVVLYKKKNKLDKSIFGISDVLCEKKNIVGNLTQGNKVKERCGKERYETRSKVEKRNDDTQRILRSRKI